MKGASSLSFFHGVLVGVALCLVAYAVLFTLILSSAANGGGQAQYNEAYKAGYDDALSEYSHLIYED